MHLYYCIFPRLGFGRSCDPRPSHRLRVVEDVLVIVDGVLSALERHQNLFYPAPIAHARRDPLASALYKFAAAVRYCGLQLSLGGLHMTTYD